MGFMTIGSTASSLLSITYVYHQLRAEMEALAFQQCPVTEIIADYLIHAANDSKTTQ